MYLDIGNNRLLDENEIIAVINVNDKFFDGFEKNDLEFSEKIVYLNEDEDITARSLVVTDKGVYKSNISGMYLMNNFMKGIE